MNNTWACEEAKTLMGASLTAQESISIPQELQQHLDGCPDCLAEYRSLSRTAVLLQQIPQSNPVPSDALWKSIESRLPAVSQEKPVQKKLRSEVSREILIAQYTYLVVLGISLWCCLTIGQPFFQQTLQGYGFNPGSWILDEYGLFILFFSLGGFVSILAAPILIQMQAGESHGKSWLRRLSKLFGGSLSLFAC